MRFLTLFLTGASLAALLLVAGCSSSSEAGLRLGTYDGGTITVSRDRGMALGDTVVFRNVTVELAAEGSATSAEAGVVTVNASVDADNDGSSDYAVTYTGVFMPDEGVFAVQAQRPADGHIESFDLALTRNSDGTLSGPVTFTTPGDVRYTGSATLERYVN